jgi:hypothetical protein
MIHRDIPLNVCEQKTIARIKGIEINEVAIAIAGPIKTKHQPTADAKI